MKVPNVTKNPFISLDAYWDKIIKEIREEALQTAKKNGDFCMVQRINNYLKENGKKIR
jgi:hypothetical protein